MTCPSLFQNVKSSLSALKSIIIYIVLISIFFPQMALTESVPTEQPKFDQRPVLLDINTTLMRSTFKIMGENGTVGTVFLLGKKVDESNPGYGYFVLVTAAHVMEEINSDSAIIFFRKKNEENYVKIPYLYKIRNNGKPLWIQHPNADVAVMYIIIPYNLDIFDIPLATTQNLSSDKVFEEFELYPGLEVKVIGFPLNTDSNAAGFPILRTGSIASFPLTPAKELNTFLIDFRVFEGNSGGPVYYYNPDWHKRGLAAISVPPNEVNIILGLVSEQLLTSITTKGYMQETKQEYPLSIAKVVHGALIKETIDMLPSKPDVDSKILPIRQMDFLDFALNRLNKKLPKDDLEKIISQTSAWHAVPSEENWTKASEAVTFSANKYNIRSSITIMSLPRSGAIIKYQTVGQRKRNEVPTTAKQLSTCVESVSIGLYHIWSERNGKQTSDINRIYEIVQPDEKIEIIEDAVSKHK